MKSLKHYGSSLILLGSISIGCILGLIFKDKAIIFKPVGEFALAAYAADEMVDHDATVFSFPVHLLQFLKIKQSSLNLSVIFF